MVEQTQDRHRIPKGSHEKEEMGSKQVQNLARQIPLVLKARE